MLLEKHELLSVSSVRLTFPAALSYNHIDTIEMLLLLIWRHVVYYVNEGESNGPQSTPHAMRFISTPNPDVFRQEVASKLAGLLQRLQEYLADATLLDEGWRPNELYAEIMCRNLREAIGIASSDIAM